MNCYSEQIFARDDDRRTVDQNHVGNLTGLLNHVAKLDRVETLEGPEPRVACGYNLDSVLGSLNDGFEVHLAIDQLAEPRAIRIEAKYVRDSRPAKISVDH